MTNKPSSWVSIVNQYGLAQFSIAQLSPAISNAQLFVKVLKILPNHPSGRTSSKRGTILIVRDDSDTAAVFCWDFTSLVRANSYQIGDFLEIQFPDIRFRKKGAISFPTTFQYDLHIGNSEQANSAPSNTQSNIKLANLDFSAFSSPLVRTFSTLMEVCNEECMNNIVTVGAVLIQVGEKRITSNTRNSEVPLFYLTCRLWDSSLPPSNEYINLTLWGSDVECLVAAQVSDFIILERVKVTKYKSYIQLSSTPHSLYHINPLLPQAEAIKSDWQRLYQLPTVLPPVRRSDKNHFAGIGENVDHFQDQTTKKRKGKKNGRNSLITDYFAPARSKSITMVNSSFQKALGSNHASANPSATVVPEITSPNTEPVFGKFSVSDALKLGEMQSCWTIACVYEILASSTRGLCVYNCLACTRDDSNCFCSPMCRSFAWSFNATIVFKDSVDEMYVGVDSATATSLIGVDVVTFVGRTSEDQRTILSEACGRAYKILFSKIHNKIMVAQMVEIPLGPIEE